MMHIKINVFIILCCHSIPFSPPLIPCYPSEHNLSLVTTFQVWLIVVSFVDWWSCNNTTLLSFFYSSNSSIKSLNTTNIDDNRYINIILDIQKFESQITFILDKVQTCMTIHLFNITFDIAYVQKYNHELCI